MTDAGNIYDGVRFVRTAVLLNQNLVVFVDQVQADKSHTFDLAVHYAGRWVKGVTGDKPQLTDKEGYQHLQDVSALSTREGATLQLEDAAIILAGNERRKSSPRRESARAPRIGYRWRSSGE